MMMMWAAQYLRLEPPMLLTAHWQKRLLACDGKVFFGGVFDKRAGMLFPTNLRFARDGHRRVGVSKIVTKNTSVGIFKIKK